MLETDLLAFIRNSVQSIWSLEVLLLLRRSAPAGLTIDEIVSALRSSPKLIDRCLDQLAQAGLISRDSSSRSRFAPATPELIDMCDRLAKASQEFPIALRDAIVSSPDDKLRNFSEAFRLKGSGKTDKGEGK